MTMKVLAVFDAAAVNRTVDLLGEHGFADDYKVLDHFNLKGEHRPAGPDGRTEEEADHDLPPARRQSNRSPDQNGAEFPDPRSDDPATAPAPAQPAGLTLNDLMDLGDLSREEAEYFMRSIQAGASLIVVEVDNESEAREVEQLLKRAGGQSPR